MNVDETQIDSIALGKNEYLLTMKDQESIKVAYNSHNVLGLIHLLGRRDIHLERI